MGAAKCSVVAANYVLSMTVDARDDRQSGLVGLSWAICVHVTISK